MSERFQTDLIRLLVAQNWFSLSLSASVALFEKAYPKLSPAEKVIVDQWVFGQIAGNFQAITPEFLQAQTAQQPMGFQAPGGAPTPES
jgi:hypothetical protein